MTTRRRKLWLIAAWIFTLINIGGGVIAAASGELLHTASHLALTLLGAFAVWRLMPHERRQHALAEHEFDQRVAHLQQSMDAVALEVERIGEAQRYAAKLAVERVKASEAAPEAQRSNDGS